MSSGTPSGTAVWSVVVMMRCKTLKASADKLGKLLDYYAGLAEDRERPGRLSRGPVVAAVDDYGPLTVTHPDRGRAVLPARYAAQHVELGWAVTGYGNQGDTVDVGIAVLEPGTTRNHAYVAMTRGRQTNLAVIPDPAGTAGPAETLTEMIARTPRHDSALAVRARLHREAGVPVPAIEPSVAPMVDDDRAAKVRATQQRLDALQARSPGHTVPPRSLGRDVTNTSRPRLPARQR